MEANSRNLITAQMIFLTLNFISIIHKYSKTECDTCGMNFETTKEYANHSSKVSPNH